MRNVASNEASAWRLGALGAPAMIVFGLISCASEPTSTAPSSVPSGMGLVDGIVRGEVAQGTRESNPTPPIAGAQVAVIAGSATGEQVTTDSKGAFQLPLPEGPFKLRWSKPGYTPVESEQGNIVRGSHITLPDVVLRTAQWAISGVVTDSRGNRVDSVLVRVEVGDAFVRAVTTTSDADGRYRIASALAHSSPVTMNASRAGFEPLSLQRIACCDLNADTPYDVHLVRVLTVGASGPSMLRVGEAVELPIDIIDLDDGTRKSVYIFPSSSAPSVVAIGSGQRGWVVRGLQPGVATITFDYHAVTTTLRIQVVA